MKALKILLLVIGISLFSNITSVNGQCANSIESQYKNYINTDPTNNHANTVPKSPNDPKDLRDRNGATYEGFKTNTFNWMAAPDNLGNNPQYHYYDFNSTPKQDETACYSPFFDGGTDYLKNIAQKHQSDFYPQDGWQLIKRDFGYTTNPVNTSQDSTANTPYNHAYIPYVILYNKYTGVLRIMGCLSNNIAIANGAQQIAINIKFDEMGQPTPPVSGLFNNYNTDYLGRPISQAMDEATTITQATTLCAAPGLHGLFFYGDFQTAYDPCTSYNESTLDISFSFIATATATLSGKFVGISQSIANIDHSSNQDFFYGQDGAADFLSSVYTDPSNAIQSGLLFANQLGNTIQEYQTQAAALQAAAATQAATQGSQDVFYNILKFGLGLISTGFTGGGQYIGGLGNVPDNKQAGIQDSLGGILQAAGSALSFFTGQIQDNSSSTQNQLSNIPSLILGDMSIAGSITTNTPVSGGDFQIANPGSCGSEAAVEIPTASTGNVMRPAYNEVLGTFAMLTTPTVYFSYNETDRTCTYDPMYFPASVAGYNMVEQQLQLKMGGNIQYAFNPTTNVDLTKSRIVCALMLNVRRVDFDNSALGSCYDSYHLLTNFHEIAADYPYQTYISDFQPIACVDEIYSEIHDSYATNLFCNGQGCVDNKQPSNTPLNQSSVGNIPINNFVGVLTPYLRVSVYLQSTDLNRIGKPNASVQEFTFPLTQVFEEGSLYNDNNPTKGFSHVTIGDNISSDNSYITATNLASNQTVNAFEKVTVAADLSKRIWNNLTIESRTVEVDPETIIGPEVIITSTGVSTPVACLDYTLNPTDPTAFCKGNGTSAYLANTASRIGVLASTNNKNIQLPVQKTFSNSFGFYPNPFNNNIQFNYSLATAQPVSMDLYDALGRHVATVLSNQQQDAGAYTLPYDATRLMAGVYTVQVKMGEQVITQKLVKTQ